jgi:diaminohydroxyphosphoribosylaminopyrimidine deaminase/5-amino-6-(5-phosphoribosylamino)uracil reductase
VHRWRTVYDAVLVGAGTVRTDDPRLTARVKGGRHPAAVVLDGDLSVSPAARLFQNLHGRRVFVCTTRAAIARRSRTALRLEKAGAILLVFRRRGRISLSELLHELYAQNLGSLLVEGGRDVFGQFLLSGMVDELTIFIAPMLIGEGVPAYAPDAPPSRSAGFENLSTRMIGRDICVKWIRALE